MPSNLDRYRTDLEQLEKLTKKMSLDLDIRLLKKQQSLTAEQESAVKGLAGSFERDYQRWYTEASAVIRQLIPDRLAEFEQLYKGDSRRKAVHMLSYTIQDWLNGVRAAENSFTHEKPFDDFAAVSMKFATQKAILEAANARFESSLLDIRRLVHADLLDSEIDAARALAAHGFQRAAGALAGVVIEAHLGQVCTDHGVTVRKKDPAINDYNDVLKNNGVIDVPAWRQIQRMADIRNLCDHKKGRDPTVEEVDELLDGTEKLTKSLF